MKIFIKYRKAILVFMFSICISLNLKAQNCSDSDIESFSACNGLPEGLIKVTPKGIAPFQIIFPNVVNGITNVQNLYASDYTFTRLPVGVYPLTVKDAANCVANFNVHIQNFNSPTLKVNSTPNTNCKGVNSPCFYDGPSAIINEFCISPSPWDGSMYTGVNYPNQPYGEGEWVEIYNPNPCNSIDVSGYILGNYNTVSNSQGMGFLIPEKTILPPNGFLVLRGRRSLAPDPSAIEIIMDGLNDRMCLQGGETSRFWFQNSGSWMALYDRNGNVQDAVSWGVPISTDLDMSPCIPSGSILPPSFNLSPYNQSNGVYLGIANLGFSFVRMPDGKAWSNTRVPQNTSIGTCNSVLNCQQKTGLSDCNGTASVEVIGGFPPYTYRWNDPLSQTTSTALNLCAGIYSVIVTDAHGCTAEIEVEIENDFFTVNTSIKPLECEGSNGQIELILDLNKNLTVNWEPNISSEALAHITSPGTYSVTVSNGFCDWDTTLSFQFKPSPVININALPTKGCLPHIVNFQNLNIDSNSTSIWGVTPLDTLVGINSNFIYTQTGKFDLYYKVVNQFGCELDTVLSDLIEVFDIPNVNIGNDTTICDGNLVKFSSNIDFATYDWQPENQNSKSIIVGKSGTYILNITDTNLCSASDTVNLIVNLLPMPNLGKDSSVCSGKEVVIGVEDIYANYEWIPNNFNGNKIKINTIGEYILKVIDFSGCIGKDTFKLKVDTLPIVNLGNDTSICLGENIILNVENIYSNYQWIPNNFSGNKITVNSTGNYILEVTNSNGCIGTDTLNLVVNPIPIPDLGKDTSICFGENVILKLTQNYMSYKWFPNNENTSTISVFTSNDYIVEVINTFNCSAKDTINVVVDTLPVIDLGQDISVCNGDNVNIGVNEIYLNYKWTPNLPNKSSQNIKTSGKYFLEVTTNNGCKTLDSINIIFNNLPIPNLGPDKLICFGDSVLLNPGNYEHYKWYPNNEKESMIWVKEAQNYVVEVTDTNNCKGRDTILIENQILDIDLPQNFYTCANENVILIPNDIHPLINKLKWNTNENSSFISANLEGKYWLTGISNENCHVTDTTELISLPYPQIHFVGDSIACKGDAIEINIITDAQNFFWNSGSNERFVEITQSGWYGVTAINQLEDKICLTKDSTFVNFYEYPKLEKTPKEFFCFEFGDSFEIQTNIISRFYKWEINESTNQQFYTVYREGNYLLEAYNHPLCKINDVIEVEEVCPMRLYVPNSFTPNDDNLNETFQPVAVNFIEYEIYIFNRWGELIYHSNTIENPWDGLYKGNLVQQDVYVWLIKISGLNNDLKMEKKQVTGTVTLYR
jgi:gliding motility-associated-like protein